LAKSFEGIFGGIFDQNVHLRDSRHAANAYGFNKSDLSNGTPRHKFEFFVKFNFNDADPAVRNFVQAFLNNVDQDIVTQMVKSVTMPSMTIETEVLNQYNKKRISQKRLNYSPVSITFHDSVEGRMLRLWEMYYEYYFKDGVASQKLNLGQSTGAGNTIIGSFLDAFLDAFNGTDAPEHRRDQYLDDTISGTFTDNFGYNLQRVGNSKYLIESIDIFQIHGGKFSRTRIMHPRVTSFSHDTLDYEDSSGLVDMRFEFDHEGVIYANINEQLNTNELERFRYGDFHELSSLITIRSPINGRDLKASALSRYPNVTTCGPGMITDSFGAVADNWLSSPFGSVVGAVVGQRNIQRVTGGVSDIFASIPGAIGSVAATSIFGGTVSFNPDPIQALKTTANQISRSVVNRTRDRFAAGVAAVVVAGASAVVSGVTSNNNDDEELAEGAGDDS
jgi:hypothetical protein